MDSIGVEEDLKQKNFIAKVFLDCYNKFRKISVTSEDCLAEFQTVLINDGQSLLLDLTSVTLMDILTFDDAGREELRNSYFNNLQPSPTNLGKSQSVHTHFINYYLMTSFFENESLKPFNNYTLGFRLIKKIENQALYYRYYHFVLGELQKLIFVNNTAENLKEACLKHKSIKDDLERDVVEVVMRVN